MSLITPRWERRAFGAPFGGAGAILEALIPRAVEESDEIYLLSVEGDNVKVRDGLIDIKVLREVDRRRDLERWEPVLKSPFPLDNITITTVFAALHQPVPHLARDTYALQEFLDELIEPCDAVRVVAVHKKRVRYTIHGCSGELSDIEVDHRHVETLAVEGEDPEAVSAAVIALGLGHRINTSVPRGLTSLVDDVPPRHAVIDVGTNSVKFHIGELRREGGYRTVIDRAEISRLGDGLAASGLISADALARTAYVIGGMADEARHHHAQSITAVGTAWVRMARNRDDVLAAIADEAGVTIDPISGEEESRLAYLAVRAGVGSSEGELVVFDTGGGSTQLTFGHDGEVDERFSVEVGAVRYTERFALDAEVSSDTLAATLAAIAADLHRLDGRPAPDMLVGMGGAVTNLTAVKLGLDPYDADAVQGAVLDLDEIDRQIELYRSRDAAARRSIVGLQPKRADVILAGVCIVRTILDKLGVATMTVSDRGLRHGLLIDRFGPTGSGPSRPPALRSGAARSPRGTSGRSAGRHRA